MAVERFYHCNWIGCF